MKICCDAAKEIKTDMDRLGCGHDRCSGTREESVQEMALRELVEMSQEMGLYDDEEYNRVWNIKEVENGHN